jgi:hypothetical protein
MIELAPIALDETIFVTLDSVAGRATWMSWTSGGRLVGLDSIEVETGRSVAGGAAGWFTGRLEVVFTNLSLS